MEKRNNCYLISENNLKTTNCSLEEILRALDEPISIVIGGAEDLIIRESNNVVQFSGLLDFGIFISRSFNWLKNERTLFRTIENLTTATSLTLGSMANRVYDDVNVSDVLQVLANIASRKDLDDDVPTKRVLEDEEKSNLVNPYQLIEVLKTKTLDALSLLGSVLVVFNNGLLQKETGEMQKKLFHLLFDPNLWQLTKVSIEVPLNASFYGTSSSFDISYEKILDITQLGTHDGDDIFPTLHRSQFQCQDTVESFLRLLVNSRDELAFATAISGPLCSIDQTDFIVIKREAQCLKMPLFQVVLSYVQKLKLGGQGLVNLKKHPFAKFEKTLADFANTIDKLQTVMEETFTPKAAVCKVLGILKSHLSSKTNASVLNDILTKMESDHEKLLLREAALKKYFPSELSGKGPLGMKNILSLRLLLDFLSAQPSRNKVPNIHILLGKVQDSVLSPALLPNMFSLFKSPLLDSVLEESEKVFKLDRKSSEKVEMKWDGKPKFASAMSWAIESSPLVDCGTTPSKPLILDDGSPILKSKLQDEDEGVRRLRGVREAAASDLKELQTRVKTLQPVKRKALSEISNCSKPLKIAKCKLKSEDFNSNENATKVLSKKEVGGKQMKKSKINYQIKGQSKITAFLRV